MIYLGRPSSWAEVTLKILGKYMYLYKFSLVEYHVNIKIIKGEKEIALH